MHALVREVVPRHAVFGQVFEHVSGDALGGREHARVLRLAVGDGEAVERPRRAARPGCVGGEALMRVREDALAGARVVRQREGLRARGVEDLTTIAGVVVHRLYDGAVGTHEPLG